MPSTLLETENPLGLDETPLPDFLGLGSREPFRYSLNTSTIRGQKLRLDELVSITAAAGYDAIEPWIDEIERYKNEGGDIAALREKIRDLGLKIAGGIGFFEWIVDDEKVREEGYKKARYAMGLIRELGGTHLAAPPFGAHEAGSAKVNLDAAAERYARLLEIGLEVGVTPQLEVWGFAANLSTLADAAYILMQTGREDANLLLDSYHLYKGESPLSGLAFLSGDALSLFHVNDYPSIAPAQITDADRVYPGDGVAPLVEIFQTLHNIGYEGMLSLELFNKTLWEQDPLVVARTGLEKLKAVVAQSV
jgi:2-keto-myo-inositol isomerase